MAVEFGMESECEFADDTLLEILQFAAQDFRARFSVASQTSDREVSVSENSVSESVEDSSADNPELETVDFAEELTTFAKSACEGMEAVLFSAADSPDSVSFAEN